MGDEVWHSTTHIVSPDATPFDERVARIAREQHGVVSVAQLYACGLTSTMISRRVACGRLHRVHRGVYAVGHDALTMIGTFVAAALACGEGAVLGCRACGAYWGFLRWEDRDIDVTVTGAKRRIAGINVHRARRLERRHVMRRDGILVMSPARTLLDLAAVLSPEALKRAVRQAQADQHVNVRQLAEVLTRANGHRGAANLRRLVAEGPVPARSPLEDLVYDPLAIADDAERQAILEAHGYRVLRITWKQAIGRPQQTLARVHAALQAR